MKQILHYINSTETQMVFITNFRNIHGEHLVVQSENWKWKGVVVTFLVLVSFILIFCCPISLGPSVFSWY